MAGLKATSKRTYTNKYLPGLLLPVLLFLLQATADPHLCRRPSNTNRQVWLSVLWGYCSFRLYPGVHKVFLCPPGISFLPVLWKFCDQIPPSFKVRFPGDSQSFCSIPRLGSLRCALEHLQQYENFFGIIVFQSVGCPPSGYVV